MVDISPTLIGKRERLNADDLSEEGRIITVTDVRLTNDREQPLAIGYAGDNGRPYYPCVTMRRVIAHLWGTDGSLYKGRKLHLYRDPTVTFGKETVGGIRIKGASHITGAVNCSMTVGRGKKKRITIQPIKEGPDNSQPKSVSGPSPREMIEAVRQTTTVDDLKKLTSEDEFKKRREWLKANRPTASEQIERAVSEALARFEAMDEEMPE